MRRTNLVVLFLCLSLNVGHASVIYDIGIDTVPLIGHPAGPFSLEIQLNDGTGIGDANNTATLTNFLFDGGSAVGSATLTGGAAGSLTSGVSLTDSSFFNQFIQAFTPGNALFFQLSLSTNVDIGGTPDEFSLAILDRTASEIPTMASFFDVLVQVDISSTNPVVRTFATDTSRTPEGGGGPINLPAPTATPVSSVPEPTTMTLMLSGLAGLLGWKRRCCR